MKNSFLKADEIFKTAEKSLLQPFRHNQIECREYREFTKLLKKLIGMVRQYEIQEYWWPTIENFRKIGLFFGSSILSFPELLNEIPIEEPGDRLFDISDEAIIDCYKMLKQSAELFKGEEDLITNAFIDRIRDINLRYVEKDKDFKKLNGFGILCPWDGLLKPIETKL